MLGTWELKYVVLLSNVQFFEMGLMIYSRYVEEPHSLRVVALTSNDNSYV
jgi:hypothetical protein